MDNPTPPSVWKKLGPFILWLALPLAVGLILSLLIPRPIVGLIYIDREIYSASANSWIAQITYARQRPQVRAVVLVVDSPGGTVIDTESTYQELVRLRQTKPVISSIEQLTASGAYYLASGTDYIYAKPSSTVGSIGVISSLPPRPDVYEDIVTTGPYKGWGAPADQVLREMEMIKQGFYQAVKVGRGSALRAAPEVLLRGQVWPGSEAMRMGLVDEMGSRSQAIEHAARLARVLHYQVVDLRVAAGLPPLPEFSYFIRAQNGARQFAPREPGLFLLYVPLSDGRLP